MRYSVGYYISQLVAILAFFAFATPADAQTACTPTSGYTTCYIYSYTGAAQSLTVPTGITSVNIHAFGAAGGGTNSSYYSFQGGGAGGGYQVGTVPVTAGSTLTVVVGQGGLINSTVSTYGGGGAGGAGSSSISHGGSGGGYSGVFKGSASQANALIIAGGGGGGSPGADGMNPGQGAGGGGGSTGGQDAQPQESGRGGTQTGGGAAATSSFLECPTSPAAGSTLAGGAGGGGVSEGGGGGGGGYYGGGGGNCQTSGGGTQNGGGGGGSSYAIGTATGTSTAAGANFLYNQVSCSGTAASGGASDTFYSSGIGTGSCYSAGGNGMIVVQYAVPKVTLTVVSNGGTGAFTFTSSPTNGWTSQTITTTAAGGAGTAGASQVLTNAATAMTFTEAMPGGLWTLASVSCTGLSSGSASISGNTFTLPAAGLTMGTTIACTVTNNLTPTFALQYKTAGGTATTGTLTQTNLASTPAAITTTAAATATPASPTAINVSTIGTAVTITHTLPTGYALTGMVCTDSNSAITGNTGSYGSVASNVATLPAANVVAGAVFNCVMTDTKIPTIGLQVTALGGTGGAFSFASANIASIASITTTAAATATPASGSVVFNAVTSMASNTTITETPPAGYALVAVACSDSNSAISGNPASWTLTPASNAFTVTTTYLKAGATITCALTDTRPRLTLVSSINSGAGGSFAFGSTSNLAATPTSIALTSTTTSATSVNSPVNVTTVGSAVAVTETPPATYFIASATCTDANAAITGNTGTGFYAINTTTGVLSINAGAIVAGADLTCTIANTLIITNLAITKTFSPAGPFALGQVVTYSYAISNTGNVPLYNVQVQDLHGVAQTVVPLGAGGITNGTLTVPGPSGAAASPGGSTAGVWQQLAPGATVTFTWPHTVTQAEIDHG